MPFHPVATRIWYQELISTDIGLRVLTRINKDSTKGQESSSVFFPWPWWTAANTQTYSLASQKKKEKDNNTAKCTCSKDNLCKGGSSPNMTKHLPQHSVNLKDRTVFNVWRSPSYNDAPDTANANSSNVSCSDTKHR